VRHLSLAVLAFVLFHEGVTFTDWSAEDLWRAYVQLTEAEAAFRIEKSDLRISPI